VTTMLKSTKLTVFAFLALSFLMPTAAHAEDEPEISIADLKQKYVLPNSQFIDIDGINVHYVDEGTGPVVVLAHASYMSLLTWDGIAEKLKQDYRVIRFDFPGAGLTGVETKPVPEEKLDMIERNYEILAGLVDALDLDHFALVGTSSGGSVAFRYAARHTDRVDRLVLANSAGMPRTAQTDPLRERVKFAEWDMMKVKPREFWEASIGANYIKPNEPPSWVLDQAYDFRRRENLEKTLTDTYRFSTGDPKAILAKIEAPTMIMWGKSNPTVMHLEADVFEHWMTGAPTMIRKLEGLGHYPYIEDEAAFLVDFLPFLGGDLDDQLRQTTRVKVTSKCDEE
jgi:pimeloyl-ACP methyl ester carboxylesterase